MRKGLPAPRATGTPVASHASTVWSAEGRNREEVMSREREAGGEKNREEIMRKDNE